MPQRVRDNLYTPAGTTPVPLVNPLEGDTNEPTMRAGRQQAYDKAMPKPPAGAYVKHGANGNSVKHGSAAMAPHDRDS